MKVYAYEIEFIQSGKVIKKRGEIRAAWADEAILMLLKQYPSAIGKMKLKY